MKPNGSLNCFVDPVLEDVSSNYVRDSPAAGRLVPIKSRCTALKECLVEDVKRLQSLRQCAYVKGELAATEHMIRLLNIAEPGC